MKKILALSLFLALIFSGGIANADLVDLSTFTADTPYEVRWSG